MDFTNSTLHHPHKMRLLIHILSVLVILEGYKIRSCLQNEREGLIHMKFYFSSVSQYGSKLLPSWKIDDEKSNCCRWEGVTCDLSSGHVTHLVFNSTVWPIQEWIFNFTIFQPFHELILLDLSNNNIQSFLPTQGVVMLKSLQNLDLSFNQIEQVPDFIWNLTSLEVLDFSECSLVGELDSHVCKLINIQELYLPSNRLNGTFPNCVWNLSSLQVLDLLGNSFIGTLPSLINLPSLEWLSIKDNKFQGKFSLNSLTNHSNLKVLLLSNNNALQVDIEESVTLSKMQLQVLGLADCNLSVHTRSIHKLLSSQYSLEYIDLSNNSLVGSFPTWLLQNNSDLMLLYLRNNYLNGELLFPRHNNLSLKMLDISNNHFNGKIPYHMGNMFSALKMLQMSNNSLQGNIPYSLGNMKQLEILDLSNNNFTGNVPEKIYSDCSQLGFLVLSNNNLEGEIIPSNMNLPYLYVLRLDGNNFVGTIKKSISKGLGFLDISGNKVTGELPTWIGDLSLLDTISLARNLFHGDIPTQICSLKQLRYLDLSENMFTGEIPSCGCPSQLTYLHLHGNNLVGPIPEGLKTCSRDLSVLDLASNQLSGGVPSWINVFPSLQILLLRDNQLQGELPIQLCQLQYLNILDVSNNSIYGVIPSCLQHLSFGATQGDYSSAAENGVAVLYSFELFKLRNHYVLQDDEKRDNDISEEVNFMVKSRYTTYKGNSISIISVLDLSWNKLSGYIPPEIGNLKSLNSLNLSHNQLSGSIPESFSQLQRVEGLDLSWNKLSGSIPSQLVDLNFLEVLNVSYNNLSGQVPKTGQFGTFDDDNYRGNPHLYGWKYPECCTFKEPTSSPSLHESGDETAFDFRVFFASFGATYIIVLFTFFLVLFINSSWRSAWFAFLDYHLFWWW